MCLEQKVQGYGIVSLQKLVVKDIFFCVSCAMMSVFYESSMTFFEILSEKKKTQTQTQLTD